MSFLFKIFAFFILGCIRFFYLPPRSISRWRDIGAEAGITPYSDLFANFNSSRALRLVHAVFRPWAAILARLAELGANGKKKSQPAVHFYPID